MRHQSYSSHIEMYILRFPGYPTGADWTTRRSRHGWYNLRSIIWTALLLMDYPLEAHYCRRITLRLFILPWHSISERHGLESGKIWTPTMLKGFLALSLLAEEELVSQTSSVQIRAAGGPIFDILYTVRLWFLHFHPHGCPVLKREGHRWSLYNHRLRICFLTDYIKLGSSYLCNG